MRAFVVLLILVLSVFNIVPARASESSCIIQEESVVDLVAVTFRYKTGNTFHRVLVFPRNCGAVYFTAEVEGKLRSFQLAGSPFPKDPGFYLAMQSATSKHTWFSSHVLSATSKKAEHFWIMKSSDNHGFIPVLSGTVQVLERVSAAGFDRYGIDFSAAIKNLGNKSAK